MRPREAVVVDGHPAHVHGGYASCDFTEVIAFVGGRLYALGGSSSTFYHPFDGQLFDAFLSTVKLDPAGADTPVASPSLAPYATPVPSPS